MEGGWDVVEQPEWHPSAEPPKSHPGWEVVSHPEPVQSSPRVWLPSQRAIDLALGTVLHISVGLLLAMAVVKLLIELAG